MHAEDFLTTRSNFTPWLSPRLFCFSLDLDAAVLIRSSSEVLCERDKCSSLGTDGFANTWGSSWTTESVGFFGLSPTSSEVAPTSMSSHLVSGLSGDPWSSCMPRSSTSLPHLHVFSVTVRVTRRFLTLNLSSLKVTQSNDDVLDVHSFAGADFGLVTVVVGLGSSSVVFANLGDAGPLFGVESRSDPESTLFGCPLNLHAPRVFATSKPSLSPASNPSPSFKLARRALSFAEDS